MEDLKVITASNIIALRTKAGMTQAELADLLNYSDKSVSKWERAEGLPDVIVLKKMSEIFDVTVDYMLTSHDKWDPPHEPEKPTVRIRWEIVSLIAVLGIFTITLLIFVIFWIRGSLIWTIFAYAVPPSLIAVLVLNSIFNKGHRNYFIITALVVSIVAALWVTFFSMHYNWWQIFILVIPAEIIVYLCFKVKKHTK